ncbi:MAG: hypothetical protein ACFFBD_27465 [Candidatus Hodarchaeota archaeon]
MTWINKNSKDVINSLMILVQCLLHEGFVLNITYLEKYTGFLPDLRYLGTSLLPPTCRIISQEKAYHRFREICGKILFNAPSVKQRIRNNEYNPLEPLGSRPETPKIFSGSDESCARYDKVRALQSRVKISLKL